MPAIVRDLDARPPRRLDGVDARCPAGISISWPSMISAWVRIGIRLVRLNCHRRPRHLRRRHRADATGSHRTLGIGPSNIVLQFLAELADRGLDRPGGAVGQAADRRAGNDADRVADLQQQVEVLEPAAAGLDAVAASPGPSACPRGRAYTGRSFRGRRSGNCCGGSRSWDRFRPARRRRRCPVPGSRPAAARRNPAAGPTRPSVITPVLSPPGTTALARRPFHTPPPNSSINCRQGMPSGAS